MKKQPKLENLGSLITYKDGDGDRCLGYLFDFTGHGVYDAALGLVEVSPEHMKAHNEALDAAMLDGLEKNCAVGQGGTFYLIRDKTTGLETVQTFAGTMVATPGNTSRNGTTITFRRQGMTFRGRTQKDADCFNFRRVA